MSIKYKNSQGNFITVQQANELEDYSKAYYDNGTLLKEEKFFENELIGLLYHNINNENHQTIVANSSSVGYKWINVVENETFSGYELKKQFTYDLAGVLSGTILELFDPNQELIAHGYKDSNGDYEYDRTRKYYWDRNINPDEELFECTYYENNGLLWELNWNNFHIDENGQESFVLLNTAADIQELRNLTGMSQDLAEYYMSSDIIPNF